MSRWTTFLVATAMIIGVTYVFGMIGFENTAEDWRDCFLKSLGGGTMLWLHWAWSK